MQDANAPGKLVHCLCSSHKASIMNRKRGRVKLKHVRSETSVTMMFVEVAHRCRYHEKEKGAVTHSL